MRILTRYILKEVLLHSLLGLLIFTFVLYLPNLNRLLEMAVEHNLAPLSMISLFLAPVPSVLVLTIPIATLVGTLIGLSRMAADGEVIAARASGVALSQFARPILIFALAGWAAASAMSLYLSPLSTRKLTLMENEIKTSMAPYEIRPRVFIEQFPNLLIYIKDIRGPESTWKGIFIADNTDRQSPKVTLAESGNLVNDQANHRLALRLVDGATHEMDPQDPQRYSVISFNETDLPVLTETGSGASNVEQLPTAMSVHQLIRAVRSPGKRQAMLVELNYRFALPVAAIVLALVGIPLGMFTRKGGKSVGVMLATLLVFLYYVIMAFGLGLAKQGRLNPFVGLWAANFIFLVAALFMLWQMRKVRFRVQFFQDWVEDAMRAFERWRAKRTKPTPSNTLLHPRPLGNRLFQVFDVYIIRGWFFYLLVMLVALTGLYVIFDFFQLLGDIVWHHAPAVLVLNYYRYLLPQVIYLMLPLSILVATLVNFSLLTKTNQVTAIKAVGISLYRISVPVLVVSAMLSAGMFILGDQYLPETNQRQDALRNEIKGEPAQTYFRPDRQWIFGEANRIYNYRFFDPDHNVFASISVFDFDAQFRMTRRIFAARAFWEPHIHQWILEDGWVRMLQGNRVTQYKPFSVATFPGLTERPSYFKKDVRPSEQMSAIELRHYIQSLQQSGFDVVRLSVQFYRKFSYPLIAFVVALIGIPFSFSVGRKGALSGIALSLLIAILYWSTSSLFEAMGNLSQLPPAIAAWSPDILFGLGGFYLLMRVRT
jgi:LPS export ABC transporter permease LptF/LPS export ABC transporter permease LptG